MYQVDFVTQPLSELPCAESDSDQSEDSDAEFLVHPILRSLIKSKSAYTMPKETPRLKTSKTAFEINLSKMWESTVDDEAPVANFTPDLDQKWPEPDAPSPPVKLYFPPYIIPRSPLRPRNSCCSAPFNVHTYRSASNSPIEQISSWSAPEYLNDSESDYDDDPEEEHVTRSCSCQGPDHDVTERKTSFLNSYPVIDSAQQVPSLCSIRLPSSSGTTTDSLSPPRPLSPVLGRPPVSANRISGSRSMQLRPRPELSSFVDNSTSDDDSPQQDPWPQQEVWPEEDVMSRSLRTGWTAAEPVTQVQRPQSSRTGFGDARHVRVSGSRSMHNQIQYAPSQLESSTRPRLDEAERRDLITRRAWIDRGSTVQLQDSAAAERKTPQVAETSSGLNIGTRCESQSDYRSDSEPADYMKRSYTTEELKRERRRLPKRPDVQPFLSELPSSLPLHGQTVDDLGEPRQQSDFSVREGDVHYYCPAASPAERRPSKIRADSNSLILPTIQPEGT
ncbi:unnamed protein product [Haemonchus placei]|uniref:PEHE domain-containing protein n=1 Tax=Haemonchus placei TaxID=6290 RepID=A0A0N4WSL6_HAEPC|nr:unnamed protein product [Haemonchus placei]